MEKNLRPLDEISIVNLVPPLNKCPRLPQFWVLRYMSLVFPFRQLVFLTSVRLLLLLIYNFLSNNLDGLSSRLGRLRWTYVLLTLRLQLYVSNINEE